MKRNIHVPELCVGGGNEIFPHVLCWWELVLPHAQQHVLCECLRKHMIV